jgi:hypothetical protein
MFLASILVTSIDALEFVVRIIFEDADRIEPGVFVAATYNGMRNSG